MSVVRSLVTRVAGPGPVRGDLITGDVHARRDPGSVLSALCPGGCPHHPGGHRRPLSPHGVGDYDRERGPRVPSRLTPRRGARGPARLSCCRKPWSEQDVRPRGLLVTVIVIVLTVPPSRERCKGEFTVQWGYGAP